MRCPHCEGTGEIAKPTIGSVVVAARRAAGMTQDQLAEKAVISRGQIANLETDRTDIPLKTLFRIAQALGVTPKDLMP